MHVCPYSIHLFFDGISFGRNRASSVVQMSRTADLQRLQAAVGWRDLRCPRACCLRSLRRALSSYGESILSALPCRMKSLGILNILLFSCSHRCLWYRLSHVAYILTIPSLFALL